MPVLALAFARISAIRACILAEFSNLLATTAALFAGYPARIAALVW
jgi:hypothetical protein